MISLRFINTFSVSVFLFYLTEHFLPAETASDQQLKNVSLRLYLGNTYDDGNHLDVFVNDAVQLLDKFDKNKSTVFYIHGYTENLSKESIQEVIDAYLKRKDHNVVAVDWSEIAAQNYIASASSTEGVGKILAQALNNMVKKSLDPKKVHVVGHSLGAQVAGFLGRSVDFKLPRITGLDPAGPGFHFIIQYLNDKDAEYVDIIHTDAGIYGIYRETGDADFYPNGGTRFQPGCPFLNIPLSHADFCSHFRSWEFWAESLINEKAFLSVKCDSKYEFLSNKCKDNEKVEMGFATPFGTKGSFYLTTNDRKPFGKEDRGVNPNY